MFIEYFYEECSLLDLACCTAMVFSAGFHLGPLHRPLGAAAGRSGGVRKPIRQVRQSSGATDSYG
jgi:hypothetical protein